MDGIVPPAVNYLTPLRGQGASVSSNTSIMPHRLKRSSRDMTASKAFGKSEMLPAKPYIGK
jgi:hypothetical protein